MIYTVDMQSFHARKYAKCPSQTRRSNAQVIIYKDEEGNGYNGDCRIRNKRKEE